MKLKEFIICAVALFPVFLSGCSKDNSVMGSANVNGRTYDTAGAVAYVMSPDGSTMNYELCVLLDGAYKGEDQDIYGPYFYLDMYLGIEPEIPAGEYSVGGDVLDEVVFSDYGNAATTGEITEIDVPSGVLKIERNSKDSYTIVFNGADENGNPVSFEYTGNIRYVG